MTVSKQKSTVVLSGLLLAIGMTLSGLIQAVIPEKICLQSIQPASFASKEDYEKFIVKQKGMSPFIAEILSSWPNKFWNYKPAPAVAEVRLTGLLYHLNKSTGKTTPKGSLHLGYTKIGYNPCGSDGWPCRNNAPNYGNSWYLPEAHLYAAEKFFCLNTSDLMRAMKEKGENQAGHYLTSIHVQVKGRKNCVLPNDKSVHSWMTAPRKGTFKFRTSTDKTCIWAN